MAKTGTTNPSPNRPTQNDPGSPSRGPMMVLVAGSLAVAGLVGWALTRTVEPADPSTPIIATAPATIPQSAAAPPTAATTPAVPSTPAAGTTAGVPRVSPAQLKDLVDSNAVTVLDVRDSVSYTNAHIPGAIHIPFSRVEAEAGNLPRGKPIVAYCT